MKIGLDFDGVIADSSHLKVTEAKRRYGVDIPPSLCKKEPVVANGWLTAEQYRELQSVVSGARELWLKMKPVKGARLYLLKLFAENHQLTIISQREGLEVENAKKWLTNQRLALDFVSVGHGQSKAEVASWLKLDVYIDDDLPKLELLVGIVPYLFLFSWRYNLPEKENGIARRVASWQEFYQAIQAINCNH